jgi:hypothetical protein
MRTMKFTQIIIDADGDPYYAWYLDGELFANGDDYHDDIVDFMNGVTFAFDFLKQKYTIETQKYHHEEWEYTNFSAVQLLDDYIKQLKAEGYEKI